MEGNNVFEDYVFWEEHKKLEEYNNRRREERKYTIKSNGKRKIKFGPFRSIAVGALTYLRKTYRRKYSDWNYILQLMEFIKFPENYIIIDDKFPTQIELGELFGVGNKRIEQVLKELQYMELIKYIKSGRNKVIYVNPYFCSSGSEIDEVTCLMFDKTTFYDMAQ